MTIFLLKPLVAPSLFLCGLLAAAPAAAETMPPLLTSAVVATEVVQKLKIPEELAVVPKRPGVRIAANASNTPIAWAELKFHLAPLSSDIKLTSCALRVVLAESGRAGSDNGVLLQLFDIAAPARQDRPIATIRVPPGKQEDTAVILRSRNLCAALETPLRRKGPSETADLARFRLLTNIRDGEMQLAELTADRPSTAPRLILTYERPGALPGNADWGQIRQDASHSGRSAWRMYDPGREYTPTSFAPTAIEVSKIRTDLRQSPLLYGGRIFAVLDDGASDNRLVSVDRSGKVLGSATRKEVPRFLAAGGLGRLAYVTENKILLFNPLDLSMEPAELAIPDDETALEAPTFGADGTFYTVTNRYVRAYTPAMLESWRYPTGHSDVGAVALSPDGATAYVLFGGGKSRLVALDSRSGDCHWQQDLRNGEGPDPPIGRGANDPMPIPVVAGPNILVTQSFPTGKWLHIIHDTVLPVPSGGELVDPPPVDACRALEAPRGYSFSDGKVIPAADGNDIPAADGNDVPAADGNGIPAADGNDIPAADIPAAVAGISADAFYIRGGKLCWGRARQAAKPPKQVWGDRCQPLPGCDPKEAKEITLLVGDSSGGASVPHLYGLAAATRKLFFISLKPAAAPGSEDSLHPSCRMLAVADLGPNLILAPDGSLLNVTTSGTLQAIVPTGFPETAKEILLSTDNLTNSYETFRARDVIGTAANLNIPAGVNIIMVAGQKIAFGPGLRIAEGARLRARVGF